jgi:ketosteroid isomerase-like protein
VPAAQYADDIAALQHMAREFTAGFNNREVDRLMRFYAESYVDVNLRVPVQTWAERRAYYLQAMSRGDIQIDVQPAEILVEGNVAFVRGSITINRTDATTGKLASTELRYLELARRTPEGSWKVFWGMDVPVQEYSPG